MSTRETRSRPCWLPSVMSISGAVVGMPLAAAYSCTAAISVPRPRVRMYWKAPALSRATTSRDDLLEGGDGERLRARLAGREGDDPRPLDERAHPADGGEAHPPRRLRQAVFVPGARPGSGHCSSAGADEYTVSRARAGQCSVERVVAFLGLLDVQRPVPLLRPTPTRSNSRRVLCLVGLLRLLLGTHDGRVDGLGQLLGTPVPRPRPRVGAGRGPQEGQDETPGQELHFSLRDQHFRTGTLRRT